MLFYSVVLLALFASAQGRAVNISNTWILPEEGFPVFYRYFRDRISWYEADAVCQFHHANLVTVDTTAQYDAVRAYLKELDISSAVWVGLIRSNPDGDFTWTDYRGLSGEGYWSSAPDTRASPLCAAADPAADYRWEARACGGPTVASFICELPVPQWALGNEGCMVRALPACTILYLPESAAVQLTVDCGLAGVKRVQCTGNVKREALLKDLSCAEEDELSTTVTLASSGNTWTVTTDAIYVEQESMTETTTEEFATTEHDINQTSTTILPPSSTLNVNIILGEELSTQSVNINKFNTINNNFYKNSGLPLIHSNNLQSNHIPKIANMDNYLPNEYQDKIDDEKHMQHKMLHEEIARLGNLDNIFTQPTDHFIPPLVMAKAKISNDMNVLSLQEKHAQQMAEQNVSEQTKEYHDIDTIKLTTEIPKAVPSTIDKILFIRAGTTSKQNKTKTNMPKKYIEKVYDPKSKVQKILEIKPKPVNGITESTSTTSTIVMEDIKLNTLPSVGRSDDDEDSTLNLTVFLNDGPEEIHNKKTFYNYSGDISKLEIVQNSTINNNTEIKLLDIEATELTRDEIQIENLRKDILQSTYDKTAVKTTSNLENYSTAVPTVLNIITEASLLLQNVSANPSITTINHVEDNITISTTSKCEEVTTEDPSTVASVHFDSKHSSFKSNLQNDTLEIGEEESPKPLNILSTTTVPIINTTFDDEHTSILTVSNISENTTTTGPYTTHGDAIANNHAEPHMEFGNDSNSSDTLDDFNSPLLSGANEPLHRPNRSRRPLSPPNRNKFNPFRILG